MSDPKYLPRAVVTMIVLHLVIATLISVDQPRNENRGSRCRNTRSGKGDLASQASGGESATNAGKTSGADLGTSGANSSFGREAQLMTATMGMGVCRRRVMVGQQQLRRVPHRLLRGAYADGRRRQA